MLNLELKSRQFIKVLQEALSPNLGVNIAKARLLLS